MIKLEKIVREEIKKVQEKILPFVFKPGKENKQKDEAKSQV